ncbi:hypothetical protein TNCV_3661251 [Trichonephila clavipes]|nr:hypothetical protein TNCV_3661251 [Trichonephila clavipes]
MLSFRDGNPLQEKVLLLFPAAMPYSGFEPEPTRLQAEGHIHHTGWAATDRSEVYTCTLIEIITMAPKPLKFINRIKKIAHKKSHKSKIAQKQNRIKKDHTKTGSTVP